ncbi:hypothetical protein HY732_02930 [Candidatus Uhrbacteria bacterium]|nr:hypothetical protein [Candidatus Uhrbacteria bacterium]
MAIAAAGPWWGNPDLNFEILPLGFFLLDFGFSYARYRTQYTAGEE